MSDDTAIGPGFWQDAIDAEAPTERRPHAGGDPPRLETGVALSVLWWLDEDEAPRDPRLVG
jgi:hypothetical protein